MVYCIDLGLSDLNKTLSIRGLLPYWYEINKNRLTGFRRMNTRKTTLFFKEFNNTKTALTEQVVHM